MNEDMKLIKFNMKIKYIDRKLNPSFIDMGVFSNKWRVSIKEITPFELIINKNTCNKYSLEIIDNIDLKLIDWQQSIRGKDINNNQVKLDSIKELISILKQDFNRDKAIQFIYWLLLIVAVDDTDYNERVSMIADFSVMIGIEDSIIRDLVKLVKFTLDENIFKSMFETLEVTTLFQIITDYSNDYDNDYNNYESNNNTNYNNGNSTKGLKDLFR